MSSLRAGFLVQSGEKRQREERRWKREKGRAPTPKPPNHSPLGHFQPRSDPSSRSLFTNLSMHEAVNIFIWYCTLRHSFLLCPWIKPLSIDAVCFSKQHFYYDLFSSCKLYSFRIVEGLKTSLMHTNAQSVSIGF